MVLLKVTLLVSVINISVIIIVNNYENMIMISCWNTKKKFMEQKNVRLIQAANVLQNESPFVFPSFEFIISTDLLYLGFVGSIRISGDFLWSTNCTSNRWSNASIVLLENSEIKNFLETHRGLVQNWFSISNFPVIHHRNALKYMIFH